MTDQTVSAETPGQAPIADLTTKIEAPAEVAEATTEQAVEQPKTEQAETAGADDGETDQPRGKPTQSQRLKRRLELAQRDVESLIRENAELKQSVQVPVHQLPPLTPAQAGQPGVDREPREQDFPNDWLAYQAAHNQWTIRNAVEQTVSKVFNQNQQNSKQIRDAEEQRERMIAYEENAHEARERIPDFDKVIGQASNIQVKPEVAEELLSSDKSALLQYHLAKNPDKVRELNGMTGRELAREIGRLEARVHLPTAKKATEATPPPKEIKGAAAPGVDPQFGPDDMNAYAAWRAKQRASA